MFAKIYYENNSMIFKFHELKKEGAKQNLFRILITNNYAKGE